MARLLLTIAVLLSTLGTPGSASAGRKTIALLDFGGEKGPQTRKRVLKFLKKSYNVYPGTKLLSACEKLGIEMKRGEALARCAQELGAVAVVGGTTAGGKLHLVVYSGKTGEPLHSGAVEWSTRPTSGQISGAFRLLGVGLSRAPASVKRTVPKPEPPSQAQPAPPPPPVATPQPVYDPSQIGGPEVTEQAEDTEPGDAVDVLDPLGGLGGISGVPYETEGEIAGQQEEEYLDPERPRTKKGFARNRIGIEATAGFGALVRRFRVSKAIRPPTYDSGIAMALRFGLLARPLAFLYDDWVAGFFLRARTDLSVGLKSEANLQLQGQNLTLKMGTSIVQVLVDLGWEWLILDEPAGPRVDFGIGFGLLDVTVNWPDAKSLQTEVTQQELKSLPDAAYRFVLLGIGGALPFAERFAAYLRASYRFILESGEIEDSRIWYGDAFVGGFGGSLGARANFSGFVATVEYGFTYHFYSFSGDRGARINNGLRGASGASDLYHTAMLNLGYAF